MFTVVWSDYMKYRAETRGFDLAVLEEILRYGGERYFDSETRRMIAIGKHGDFVVAVPYEETDGTITPVTVHVITRQQIRFRLQNGRFKNEQK